MPANFKEGEIGEVAYPQKSGVISPQTNINEILQNLSQHFLKIAFTLAIFAIIIAGIIWITALGDENKIEKAKRIIKWTIIALLIASSAFVIVKIIIGIF